MFHWQNNWYFGRTSQGQVCIRHYVAAPSKWPTVDEKPLDGYCDAELLIDEGSWASIVSTVSKGGEAKNYEAAKILHAS